MALPRSVSDTRMQYTQTRRQLLNRLTHELEAPVLREPYVHLKKEKYVHDKEAGFRNTAVSTRVRFSACGWRGARRHGERENGGGGGSQEHTTDG